MLEPPSGASSLVELAALAEERGGTAFEPSPEALIREDRQR